MTGARIAVVVPCYDDGATAGETIDSVREQEPVDIIVVDDGSRDPATVALLDELAAAGRIQLVRKPNGGVASALRAGFEAAVTPYVFVLASDDVAEAGALADLADALDGRRSTTSPTGTATTSGTWTSCAGRLPGTPGSCSTRISGRPPACSGARS